MSTPASPSTSAPHAPAASATSAADSAPIGASGRSSARRPNKQRRGTVLLMVIGVLALLSIIAVVYATLGRTDRAVSATIVRQEKINDQSSEIAEYLAQQIADGTFRVMPEWGTTPSGGPIGTSVRAVPPLVFRRIASDYPFTDRYFVSVNIPTRNEAQTFIDDLNAGGGGVTNPFRTDRTGLDWNITLDRFDPTGTMLRPTTNGAGAYDDTKANPRVSGVPFLMPSEPLHLRDLVASSGATLVPNRETANPGAIAPPLLDRRDWATITNIFPSGNFINLANLRNNFNAESGWGIDTSGKPRMSQGLTLYKLPGVAGQAGRSFDLGSPTAPNTAEWTAMRVPHLGFQSGNAEFDRQPNPLIPADWTRNQLFAARPMREEFFLPNDYANIFNQWADADGDGIADSRWGELVDVSGFFTAVGANGNRARSVITSNSRMRLFVAVRIIDASGMVNVNTATDSVRMPGQTFDPAHPREIARDLTTLAGTTAAEVDLRRILMGVDFDRDYILWLDQLRVASGPELPRIGGQSAFPSTGDNLGNQEPWDTLVNDVDLAPQLGAASYLALQRELLRGQSDPDRTGSFAGNVSVAAPTLTRQIEWTTPTLPADIERVYWPYVWQTNSTPATQRFSLTPLTQLIKTARATSSGGTPRGFEQSFTATSQAQLEFGAPFDLADELELRTYHGANNPDTTSRLESILGGRLPSLVPGFATPVAPVSFSTLSPVRDNRPLTLEIAPRLRFNTVQFANNGPPGLFGAGPGQAVPLTDIDRRRADRVLISMFADIRKHLTTVNGSRPLIERVVGISDATSSLSPTKSPAPPGPEALTLNVGNDFSSANTVTTRSPTLVPILSGNAPAIIGLESSTPPLTKQTYSSDVSMDLTPVLSELRSGALKTNAISKQELDRARSCQKLFNFYLSSLAPFRNPAGNNPPYKQLWPDLSAPNTDINTMAGLAYAGNTELAVHRAIAMTVNTIDALDTDESVQREDTNPGNSFNPNPDLHIPTALSVVIEPNFKTSFDPTDPFDPKSPGPGRAPDSFDPLATGTKVNQNALFPWPKVQIPDDLTRKQAYGSAVPPAESLASSRALNVFGFEPQPFLIEVAALFLYSDARNGTSSGVPQPAPNPTRVAIDLTNDNTSNKDFIGEVLAFQLTNPFDDEIILYADQGTVKSTLGANRGLIAPRYYIRYAGKVYAIVEQQEGLQQAVAANARKKISLLPGQTRTFYAMNPPTLQEWATNLEAARPTTGASPLPITIDDARRWLWKQLGDASLTNGDARTPTGSEFIPEGPLAPNSAQAAFANQFAPVNILQVDPASDFGAIAGTEPNYTPTTIGATNPAPEFLWGNATSTTAKDERKVATLWRVLRPLNRNSLTANADKAYCDLMVDRLRDPLRISATTPPANPQDEESTLFKLRDDLNGKAVQEIAGSDEGSNAGLSIVFWAKFSRPTADIESRTPATNSPRGYMYYPPLAAPLPGGTQQGAQPRRGILPPWCIEAKADNDFSLAKGNGTDSWSLNQPRTSTSDLGAVGSYNNNDYNTASTPSDGSRSADGEPMRFLTLNDLVDAKNPVVKSIRQSAYEKDTEAIEPSFAYRPRFFSAAFEKPTWSEVAPEIHFVGLDETTFDDTLPGTTGERTIQHVKGVNGSDTQRKTSRNPALFSRVGDLLLPLGVCAMFDPTNNYEQSRPAPTTLRPSTDLAATRWTGSSSRPVREFEYQWTTISEALAMATGYYSPRHGPLDNPQRNLYFEFGGAKTMPSGTAPAATDPLRFTPKLERGCLRIDAFTPYRLLKSNEPNGNRESLGMGVPFALNILTTARLSPGLGTTQRNKGTPSGLVSDTALGSVNESVPGKINLNTASTALAAVPLIKPMRPLLDTGASPGVPLLSAAASFKTKGVAQSWTTTYPITSTPTDTIGEVKMPFWGDAGKTPSLFKADPTGATGDYERLRWDMATSIRAYRDKITLQAGIWKPTGSENRVDFVDSAIGPVVPSEGRWRQLNLGSARWQGLREQPGFRSVGELLAVNRRRDPRSTTDYRYDSETSMQRFGLPERPLTGANQYFELQHPSLTPSRYLARAASLKPATPTGPFALNDDGTDPLLPRAGEFSQGGTGGTFDKSQIRQNVDNPATKVREIVTNADPTASQRIDTLQSPNIPNSYSGKLAIANAALASVSVRSDVFVCYFLIHGYLPEDTIVNDDPSAGPIEPMVPSLQKRFVMVVDRSNVVKPGDRPKILFLKEVPVGRN